MGQNGRQVDWIELDSVALGGQMDRIDGMTDRPGQTYRRIDGQTDRFMDTQHANMCFSPKMCLTQFDQKCFVCSQDRVIKTRDLFCCLSHWKKGGPLVAALRPCRFVHQLQPGMGLEWRKDRCCTECPHGGPQVLQVIGCQWLLSMGRETIV